MPISITFEKWAGFPGMISLTQRNPSFRMTLSLPPTHLRGDLRDPPPSHSLSSTRPSISSTPFFVCLAFSTTSLWYGPLEGSVSPLDLPWSPIHLSQTWPIPERCLQRGKVLLSALEVPGQPCSFLASTSSFRLSCVYPSAVDAGILHPFLDLCVLCPEHIQTLVVK